MIDTLTLAIPIPLRSASYFFVYCLNFTEAEAKDYILRRRGSILTSTNNKTAAEKIRTYKHYIISHNYIRNLRITYNDFRREFYIVFVVSAFEVAHQRKAKPNELFDCERTTIGDFFINIAGIVINLFAGLLKNCPDEYVKAEVREKFFFNNIKVWRIDYSKNLNVATSLLKLYLHLYNCSVLERRKFKRKNKFKKNAVRVSNKQTTVIMYDKYAETQVKHPELASYAEGIIRVEVQHRKPSKVRELKEKYGNNADLMSKETALTELTFYWHLLLPEGDFFKQNAMIKKLDGLPARQRNKIIAFLKFLQLKHSIATAREKYNSNQTFDKHLHTISSLGIAPYAVPIHKCRDYSINERKLGSCLPSLFPQIA